MISRENVENIIGHAVGGVCPFGIKENIKTTDKSITIIIENIDLKILFNKYFFILFQSFHYAIKRISLGLILINITN